VLATAVLKAPVACADDGWVAVANSPNHEQQDWGFGPDQISAEVNALARCAVLERATDCRILAVSTDCVATAWDVSEPLNQIYAGSGGGPEAAVAGATAAAGPYANDIQVRCTWWPRNEPGPAPTPTVPPALQPPGTSLALGFSASTTDVCRCRPV
ncbi:MAG: hypothetical protein ACR2JM_13490, partial [Mycobacterium sp.]